MLSNCKILVDGIVLWTYAYILENFHYPFIYLLIEEFDWSRSLGYSSSDYVERSRFACTIGAEQTENLTFVNRKTVILNCNFTISINFCKIFNFYWSIDKTISLLLLLLSNLILVLLLLKSFICRCL